METGDPRQSLEFLNENILKMFNDSYPLEKFIITKTLKNDYKIPEKIVHKVLADRMGERDPGNKPKANDRIAYAYVVVPEKPNMLQGDRVEHPDYIVENKLKLDYRFYLSNQLTKPISRVFALKLDVLPKFDIRKNDRYWKELQNTKKWNDKRLFEEKMKYSANLLFGKYYKMDDVIEQENIKKSQKTITNFFGIK